MKKIIFIEDSSFYYKIVSDICSELYVPLYPKDKTEFQNLRSAFPVVLARPGAYKPEFQDMRTKWVSEELVKYIGDTNDEDILCICDYQLSEARPEATGVTFYERFLGEKAVMIISATTNKEEIDLIINFCSAKPDRVFVQKNSDDPLVFKKLLATLITAFSLL